MTKPIPTCVSNNYACFANDDDDDDDDNAAFVCNIEAATRAPKTGKPVQQLITKTVTSTGRNDSDHDDGKDAGWVPSVTVGSSKLQTNTVNSHTAALDLGSMVNNNKNEPDFDMFGDVASQVTVATKNSAEGNYTALNTIPHVLSNRAIPMKPKKHHKNNHKNKNKKKSTRKKHLGKQGAGSNEATGSSKRDRDKESPDESSPGNNNSTGGNNNSNAHHRGDIDDTSNQWNDERCPRKLGGDNDETELDNFQEFSINFTFSDVPKDKAGTILTAFISTTMMKDNMPHKQSQSYTHCNQ